MAIFLIIMVLFGIQKFAEADSFFCFVELLSGFRDNFCQKLDNSAVGIRGTLAKLSQLVAKYDAELQQHLEITTEVSLYMLCSAMHMLLAVLRIAFYLAFQSRLNVLTWIKLWSSYDIPVVRIILHQQKFRCFFVVYGFKWFCCTFF